ncbi:uroporphyrinogen-III C-methyltransferase [Paenibacillus thermoaerophilus]|uniref:uroporphyrinogen-III C-methyltransferase n=1 Tax=Paenibacillus thermoaerophilus TaxID=1215385 RepID=A0ABW2V6B2_9BACL|nr:uroporphyrinogen-III C-methyltransferase [Paenibacillus thermoaerophilus]TMV11090.1 uroporphyrinogen-III C-methyltransferase [Paenibacillus thermoaerophilus]
MKEHGSETDGRGSQADKTTRKGKVYLVGAGPGDAKLITLRGLEALRKADAIVYDRLASPRLLQHARPDAERIFVGKLPDKHMMKQSDINVLLKDLALQGKTVVRLKGGDPAVFGRVGEEAEVLVQHGIEFEIVPGITSAIAVPAYAGIPVTHRDLTSSFAIITGHEYPNKTYKQVDFKKLAAATGTLIFLMGVANLGNICRQLLEAGKPADLPVALIRWGTWMEQQTLVGTLSDIEEKVREAGFTSPAVIIAGDVVRLREKLAWFEKKPLFGRRILVTRARSQASELADLIDELGGEPIEFPVISLRTPEDPDKLAKLDEALSRLDAYNWVVFTSVNGVEFFFKRLRELRIDIRRLASARIAAVGPKTAEALAERGLIAELLPGKFQAEDLFEALKPLLAEGDSVLLPRSAIAREILPEALREIGVNVTVADVYENVVSDEGVEDIVKLLKDKAIHVVTFTSSSTVKNLLAALDKADEDPLALLEGAEIACIGPVTAATAERAGLRVTYMAEEATVRSLVEAIAAATGKSTQEI